VDQKILLVEDEPNLADTLIEYLKLKQFSCDLASNVHDAKNMFKNYDYPIVLLDIGLPDGNGIELGQDLRKINPNLVILFISALNDPNTRLQGLELGAEDYITKPFELKELHLRLSRILKTKSFIKQTPDELEVGGLCIWFKRYQVQDGLGEIINLNQKECAILELLWRNQSKVVSRDQMIDEIWGNDAFPSNRTVDNYIVRLRRWAESDPEKKLNIDTVRGIGYRLNITN
jgi:two-component system alkaline phosphatase synthesis response regulator PhoP